MQVYNTSFKSLLEQLKKKRLFSRNFDSAAIYLLVFKQSTAEPYRYRY